MRWNKLIKTIIAAAAIIVATLLWPGYQAQIPRTEGEISQAILAEIAQVPVTAPLKLIIQPDDGHGILKDAIANASISLALVIYELEDREIEQDLVDAHNRGINVRVILQNVSVFGNHPNQEAYDFLKNNDVPVIWARKYFALTHQKTLIVDGQWAIIMTYNLDDQYYATSRDFGLINHDSVDMAAISAAFESDWNGSQIAAENGRDLVWSPGSAPTLIALIDSAIKTLDIYALEMEDDRIEEALKRAAQRGVAVRVMMTYATNWKKPLTELVASGVNVRTFAASADIFIHAKVIITDGKVAYVGSENFSQQSLDRNRELGMLISRGDIIASLNKTFSKDWGAARPYGNSPAKAGGNTPAGMVKMSKSGICHPPDSGSYNQTKNFTPYNTIGECLAAGGRLPANYGR